MKKAPVIKIVSIKVIDGIAGVTSFRKWDLYLWNSLIVSISSYLGIVI